MPNKLTDNEIIKALECSVNGKCPECPYFHSYPCDKCRNMRKDALDLINRQKEEKETMQHYIDHLQAEIEMLERQAKANDKYAEALKRGINVLGEKIKTAKAEAYKEFYEELHTEILKARDSNFKAKEERIAKSKEYGIPIDVDDNFLMYCDGKIHALDGIDYFAYETLKEMESANND